MLFSIANAGSDGSLEIGSKSGSSEINDCFEKINRGIFAFNQGLDKVIFKPLATGYRKLPQPVRSGASNALGNLSNVVTIPNNFLQGDFKDAGVNTLRFVINTTLGIGGLFDVASYYGLEKREKEFKEIFGSINFIEVVLINNSDMLTEFKNIIKINFEKYCLKSLKGEKKLEWMSGITLVHATNIILNEFENFKQK